MVIYKKKLFRITWGYCSKERIKEISGTQQIKRVPLLQNARDTNKEYYETEV